MVVLELPDAVLPAGALAGLLAGGLVGERPAGMGPLAPAWLSAGDRQVVQDALEAGNAVVVVAVDVRALEAVELLDCVARGRAPGT